MSVGYDLYLKLLEEAVLEERGEEKKIETECAADLTLNANIRNGMWLLRSSGWISTAASPPSVPTTTPPI